MIYMDNAATTKIKDSVLREMMPYFTDFYGNASSIYSLGQKSRAAIENSRIKIANILNVAPSEIYFTSSGSEADNWAIKETLKEGEINHIISSKIEHPAVLNSLKYLEKKGHKIDLLDVDRYGFVDLDELREKIDDKTNLVSIMSANNEIGTIEPIEEIAEICKEHGVLFHTDAVQAFGNIDIDLSNKNIDMWSMSGHKIGAPKGVGILYIKDGTKINSFINGGSQERDMRASTENVAYIVGLAKAVEDAYNNLEKNTEYTENLRNYMLEKLLKIDKVLLNGPRDKRLPGNINISIENLKPQTLVQYLDMFDICVSQGSACAAGSIEPSYVLSAIGRDKDLSLSTIRISLNSDNTKEECDFVVDKLKDGIKKFSY
ncbi:cysteine desulfurase family protein [Peptoniphilus sp.]|uniref:cysteine desulfurase family protein n=1 Tax=Peptoniphilus sp. TaxID=1971214 RepID=UPI003D916CF4